MVLLLGAHVLKRDEVGAYLPQHLAMLLVLRDDDLLHFDTVPSRSMSLLLLAPPSRNHRLPLPGATAVVAAGSPGGVHPAPPRRGDHDVLEIYGQLDTRSCFTGD